LLAFDPLVQGLGGCKHGKLASLLVWIALVRHGAEPWLKPKWLKVNGSDFGQEQMPAKANCDTLSSLRPLLTHFRIPNPAQHVDL